jgi:hypothetical protein
MQNYDCESILSGMLQAFTIVLLQCYRNINALFTVFIMPWHGWSAVGIVSNASYFNAMVWLEPCSHCF